MQWLPPLSVDGVSWRLPLSDRTAATLTRVLCLEVRDDATELLTRTLRIDPALALWGVCRAKSAGLEPRDAAGLASWLVEHLVQPDDWTGNDDAVDEALHQSFAEILCESVVRAQMAASLAAEAGQGVAEEAYLAGLLHGADKWMRLAGGAAAGASERFAPMLPSWLLGAEVNPWVVRAGQRLGEAASSRPPPGREVERSAWLAGCAVDAWTASDPESSVPLGRLIAKLGRLKALETDFQRSLQAEKLEAMAEFAAGAGHEINNPLAVIAGRAQLLLQEETDPERRRTLALMNTQAKRVYEMIADMMLFARPPAPAFEQLDLVALVDHVVDDLRPQMAEHAVSLRRAGREGPLAIEADPVQLNVALRALCRNALEAIGHDGRVEIALDETADGAILRVRDNGPGISAAARAHLFDPYYSERQAGRGLGLGLSKCWRIVVTNHHGSITVESEPGSETVFTLTLPKRHPRLGARE